MFVSELLLTYISSKQFNSFVVVQSELEHRNNMHFVVQIVVERLDNYINIIVIHCSISTGMAHLSMRVESFILSRQRKDILVIMSLTEVELKISLL